MKTENEMLDRPLQSGPVYMPGEAVMNSVLVCPEYHAGIIVFCQEHQHNRHLNNCAVAKIFNKHKLATLLPDFSPSAGDACEPAEQFEQRALWLHRQLGTSGSHMGYFAAGADAAATALAAAAHRPGMVRAVVACGGRPDLLHDELSLTEAPVLLIAGGRDSCGLRSCQRALEKLNGSSAFNVIPRASQSFEETGVMEEVAQLAALWFLQHLGDN